ncbi:MAG TPA: HK97 gp10 family phage protein [Clostridia bacterium]|nr:HK97 gp10 family phage protein [Clostridia bacterium]
MISIKIDSNLKAVNGDLDMAIEKALYSIGVTAQGDIVKYMSKPDFTGKDIVDTGRLRGSISFVTPEKNSGANDSNAKDGDALSGAGEDRTVIIGSNVEYADYVNNGTLRQPARKFMENGIEPNAEKYQKLARDIFEGKV